MGMQAKMVQLETTIGGLETQIKEINDENQTLQAEKAESVEVIAEAEETIQ